MSYWLLVRGTGVHRLDVDLRTHPLARHSSSRRPAVRTGDCAILYAAVWQAVFAVVEIAGDPEHDPTRTRWAWSFPLRPVVALDSLEHAPAVEEAGVFPSSLWRHSHVRLSPSQYTAARSLIEAARERSGSSALRR